MLPTTANFDLASINDELRVVPRVRWWYSWNHLLGGTVTENATNGASIDTDLLPLDSVLNERHMVSSGSAYAITGEARTSTDPRFGFRLAPSSSEINPIYQSSNRTAGANNGTVYSDIQVVYPEAVDANVVEVQMEAMRLATGTMHTPKISIDVRLSGVWTNIVNQVTVPSGNEGRYVVYYNGTSWATAVNYANSLSIEGVRLRIYDTTTNAWNPKVRYVGAHMVYDVTDDIVDFSIDKDENEQLSYMPFGEPNSNSARLTLDNTAQEYAFKPVGSIQPKFDTDMKVVFELGLDLSPIGEVGIEYIAAGTYYIDSIDYDTDMILNMSLSDRSKFLQTTFLDNCFWEGKSLKFIIKDVLARTGLDPSVANFEFGVTGNIDETNKIGYCWYRSDATVWQALSELVKSEIGTVMIDEQENYVFTDREFLNNKYNDGVQWTIDADIELEAAQQDFTVDANEVKITYKIIGPNIDQRGIVSPSYVIDENGELTTDFTTTGPIEISSVLWEPSGTLSLNSASLYETLTDTGTYIRIDRPLGDTFPESGMGNINGEYISWDGKSIQTNYVQLNNLQRGLRYTTPDNHYASTTVVNTMINNSKSFYTYSSSLAPSVSITEEDGQLIVKQICQYDPYQTWTCIRPFGSTVNFDNNASYGTTLTFKATGSNQPTNNIAGIFVHTKNTTWDSNKAVLDTYWIEILSLTELARNGYAQGTVRCYRTSDKHTVNQRTGIPPTELGTYGFPAAIVDNDIPVRIDLYWFKQSQLFNLYINNQYLTSFQSEYDPGEIESAAIQASPHKDNLYHANQVGSFGIFVHGNTKAAFEYFYGGKVYEAQDSNAIVDWRNGGFANTQKRDRWSSSYSYGPYSVSLGGGFMEFAPVLHEAREFSVEHQVWPNRWARVFNSNTLDSRILEQNHSPFSSEFTVVNTSRDPAILVGNDESTLYNGLGINHQFFVYGGTITEKESKLHIVRNKDAIRKRGLKSVQIDNPWIQGEEKAKAIGNWISNNWAEPVDFYTIDWFPVWALQPGDRVNVSFEEKGFSEASNIWFIKGMSIKYDGGLSGSVQLQRRTVIV